MAIDALTVVPTRDMTPTQFIAAADTHLEELILFQTQANAAAEAMNLNATSGTSATSNSIGTGSKSFTADTGKSWLPGMFLVIADTAAPSTNSMTAQVTSYNTGTGALVVDVKGTLGSGTKTAWTISQTANPIPLDQSVTTGKLAESVFNGLPTVSPNLADFLSGADASDSGNKKKFLLEAIRDLFYPRGHLAGVTLSTAGSSTTMSIAAGEAKDSSDSAVLQLSAAINKTTSAWAVGSGNGGLDTGTIANSTGYHFYLIRRPDTGVVDVVFSTSASSPTLPTGYTQYRRIGWGKTNGAGQWTSFVQDGDFFQWDAAILDVAATNPGTAAVTRTLTVPAGINVLAVVNMDLSIGATGSAGLLSDLSVSDQAPSTSSSPLGQCINTNASSTVAAPVRVRTNTSSQVRSRLSYSDASCILRIATCGWYDSRGRDN